MIGCKIKRKWINKILLGILSIGILFLGGTFVIGNQIYEKVIGVNINEAIDRGIEPLYQGNQGIVQKFYSYKSQELTIPSRNGYNINGIYIKAPHPTSQTVIFVHELGPNKWANIEWAFMYLKNNYNVVLYNQRAVGSTGGERKSFGYYEKIDLASVVQYIRQEYPSKKMGIHGFGVGAATTALYCGTDEANERIDFFIMESPYDSMKEALTRKIESIDSAVLPTEWILWMNDKYLEMTQRFGYEDVSPKEAVKHTTIPMLIIHGDEDKVYPIEMGVDIYNNKQKGYKDLWIIEGGKHNDGFKKYPQEYEKKVMEFIETSKSMNKKAID